MFRYMASCVICNIIYPKLRPLFCAKVSSGDCPHLLFYGPPGAGKKTLIIGLLRQIYGPAVEKVSPSCMALWRCTASNASLALTVLTFYQSVVTRRSKLHNMRKEQYSLAIWVSSKLTRPCRLRWRRSHGR